jgi:hypothetical protein
MSLLLAGLAALCVAPTSSAQEKLVVMVPAVLDPNAPISDAARRECNVDTNVGTQVFERVAERYPGTQRVAKPDPLEADKTFVKVTLLNVVGHGGGGWSGPKAITIRADVLRGPKVMASLPSALMMIKYDAPATEQKPLVEQTPAAEQKPAQ